MWGGGVAQVRQHEMEMAVICVRMKKFLQGSLVITTVSLAACAPATTLNSYVDANLSKASLSNGGITVLPLLLGEGVKDVNVPELRRELSRRTGESIKKYFPTAQVTPSETTLAIFEEKKLLDDYNTTAIVFDKTGSLKSDVLVKLTGATGNRYVILPYLQSATTSVSVGLYGVRSYTHNASFSMVIWDKEQQKTVYEGSGSHSASPGFFKQVNILDAAYGAFDKAGEKLTRDIK